MVMLSVNVNKIATLRNSRGGNIPDLIEYSKIILDAGAYGITVHPRSDERHITYKDTKNIAKFLRQYRKSEKRYVEYNIEGEMSDRFYKIISENNPDQVTLVPVKPGEITSDHGFDLKNESKKIYSFVKKLRKSTEARISLFVEAIPGNLKYFKDTGADRIELYTGPFAEAFDKNKKSGIKKYNNYKNTALKARELGIGINAGHDLDHINLEVFKHLPGLLEVSIGHRLMSYALKVGLENSVKTYLQTLSVENENL